MFTFPIGSRFRAWMCGCSAAVAMLVTVAVGVPDSAVAAEPAQGSAAEDSRTTELSCSVDGFSASVDVVVAHDAAAGKINAVLRNLRTTPPPGQEGARPPRVTGSELLERSFVSGIPEKDYLWYNVGDVISIDDNRNVFSAEVKFTFDKSLAEDPSCTATKEVFVLPMEQPAVGQRCAADKLGWLQMCWRATEDSILALTTTEHNVDWPEYLVLNADDSIDHEARLTGGMDRIWLRTGQAFVLTAPVYWDGTDNSNVVTVSTVRPFTDGVQPEAGEECSATNLRESACFVAAPHGYKLELVVTEKYSDAPAYVVRDASGRDVHGGRLEIGTDAQGNPKRSTIWIDAGDRLSLFAPTLPHAENRIEIVSAARY